MREPNSALVIQLRPWRRPLRRRAGSPAPNRLRSRGFQPASPAPFGAGVESLRRSDVNPRILSSQHWIPYAPSFRVWRPGAGLLVVRGAACAGRGVLRPALPHERREHIHGLVSDPGSRDRRLVAALPEAMVL